MFDPSGVADLIECVPNVSEGRRPDVVSRMSEAIQSVAGVRLLNHSSDPAHHRSVFTFVGAARDVQQAVVALFERAVAENPETDGVQLYRLAKLYLTSGRRANAAALFEKAIEAGPPEISSLAAVELSRER